MSVLRLLAGLFLLIAVVAFLADATPWLNGTTGFEATSLATHWKDVAPASLERAQASVVRNAPDWVWSPLITSLLGLPTFLLFGVLAALAGFLGRHRKRIDIFAN